MQITTTLTITEYNKESVMSLLQRLESVSAISQYELKDLLEKIKNYEK